MSHAPVDLLVTDSTPQTAPVSGVVIQIYSFDGKIYFGQATTDGSGHAGFLLPDGTTYQARFYKFQVAFMNPQYLAIQPSPAVNSFTIQATLTAPPISRDARLCVAFGYFRNGDGSPQAGLALHFIPKFKPLIVDGNAIMPEQIYEKTDKNGYIEVTLFRLGHYDVTVTGLEDYQRYIRVPDQVNVNLPDLLFPVLQSVTFSSTPPTSMSVGQHLQITPSVHLSDGNVDCTGQYDVHWSSDNPDVLGVAFAGGVLTLTGISAGTANVVGVPSVRQIVHIPDLPLQGVPLPITVS